MKKWFIILIFVILMFSSIAIADSNWSEPWNFDYKKSSTNPNDNITELPTNETIISDDEIAIPEEPIIDEPTPDQDPVITGFGPQAGYTLCGTLTFGGKATIQGTYPILSNPNPSNGATDVSKSTSTWNITIENFVNSFNWTIQSSVGSNSANLDTNGSKSVTLSNLQYSINYTIWVNASHNAQWTRETFWFIIEDDPYIVITNLSFGGKCNVTIQTNASVVFSNPYPTNGSTNVPISQTTWNITIQDPEGYPFNWSIQSSVGSNSSDGDHNNSFEAVISGNLSHGTTYTFYVNATDGNSWTNETFNFQTVGNSAPTLSYENPLNNSIDNNLSLTWNVTIEDAQGHTFNWTIQCGNGQSSSANGASNGSKTLSISGLSFGIIYTVWANVTDSYLWNRTIYNFKTEDLDIITFTRILQTPSNIRMNDTTSNTSLYVTYNLTTNHTDINETSVFGATVVNSTLVGCLNTTYKLPATIYYPNKMESTNRECIGGGYWWEALFNNTGTKSHELGYCSQWGVRNATLSGNFTINSHGSNWTNISFNPRMYRIPSTIQMVDYSDRVKEDKSNQLLDVYSGNLVKNNFNMTDTDFYSDPLYNHTLYTLFFNFIYSGNPSKDLQVYFANNSYDIYKGDPAASPYCTLIKAFLHTDPITYQTKNGNSSYHNATFSTDANGNVGAIHMTSNFSVIFKMQTGNAANSYDISYADNNVSYGNQYHEFNQSETTETSTDGGDSWAFRNGTIDCYLNFISLDDKDKLMYKVYAQTVNDTHGGGNWSAVQTDLFDESNYAPNNPDVTFPDGESITNVSYIGNTINITYGWLGDPNLDTCWVNTTCHNETHVIKAYIQNRSITAAEYALNNSWYYNWDTTGMTADSDYYINMTVTDSYGLFSYADQNGTFELQDNLINVTINGSANTEETNTTLFGQLINNGSSDATCWFQWKNQSSDFTTPDGNTSVGIIANGVGFSSYIGNLSNGTFYYFRTRANNSLGWNNSWNTSYFLTKPQSATGLTVSEIGGGFNVSWTHGDGTNVSYLVVNTTHVPSSRTDGTNIYYGPNNWFDHTVLDAGQTYYYRIWEYANWSNPTIYQWSDGDTNTSGTYQGNLTVLSNPNPANNSVDISINIAIWNITIESPNGHTFNWTIESSVGSNSSNANSNGSKNIYIYGNLSYDATYPIWVNASEEVEANWSNETFQFTTAANTAPAFSNPNPANQSGDIDINLYFWNITINDAEGSIFNWSIETSPNVGVNSSTGSSNGSFLVNVSGNLSYEQTITCYVNVTDGNDTNNETFWFKVEDNPLITWANLTFGGKVNVSGVVPILSNEQPSDGATSISMYPMLNITVTEPQGQNFNITWSTNASGSWVNFAWNSSCSNGTYRQRATWANASNTIYGWQVHVNDTSQNWTNATYEFQTATYTWSNWSAWWTFNYSAAAPTNLVAAAYNKTVINLTWDAGNDGADTYVLVFNESGWISYPLTPQNGTEIYNGTNLAYNHTGLIESTAYYYTIWSWNVTESNYSIGNDSAAATTQGNITTFGPYPVNQSTTNNRPPINISIQINGTALDIYYYYWNMTPWPNTYNLLYNWSNKATARYEVLNLDTTWSDSFEWGNHDYNWSVNITDSVIWFNNSYTYTTKGSRYDVTNSGDVISGDVSATWTNRQGEASYNGIYDVDHSGDVVSGDLSLIWANRT